MLAVLPLFNNERSKKNGNALYCEIFHISYIWDSVTNHAGCIIIIIH